MRKGTGPLYDKLVQAKGELTACRRRTSQYRLALKTAEAGESRAQALVDKRQQALDSARKGGDDGG